MDNIENIKDENTYERIISLKYLKIYFHRIQIWK